MENENKEGGDTSWGDCILLLYHYSVNNTAYGGSSNFVKYLFRFSYSSFIFFYRMQYIHSYWHEGIGKQGMRYIHG